MSLLALAVTVLCVLYALLTVLVIYLFRQFGTMYLVPSTKPASTTTAGEPEGIGIGQLFPDRVKLVGTGDRSQRLVLARRTNGSSPLTAVVLADMTAAGYVADIVREVDETAENFVGRLEVVVVERAKRPAELGFRARHLADPTGAIFDAVGAGREPEVVLVDRHGVVRGRAAVDGAAAFAQLVGSVLSAEPHGVVSQIELGPTHRGGSRVEESVALDCVQRYFAAIREQDHADLTRLFAPNASLVSHATVLQGSHTIANYYAGLLGQSEPTPLAPGDPIVVGSSVLVDAAVDSDGDQHIPHYFTFADDGRILKLVV